MIKTALALTLFALPSVALAESQQPYAGLEQRPVKALSEQQVSDLRAGRGMGLALPAELNGYPGPSHVLENAEALALTADQRERTKALFDAMKAEAIPAGEQLLEQEIKLDGLFASKAITQTALRSATQDIGAAQARLREAHLKYHLAMMTVLTPVQVERYRALRGYAPQGSEPQHHQHRQ
jgi:Spy/CpxP family protein refolding chaperone